MRCYNLNNCINSFYITPEKIGNNNQNCEKSKRKKERKCLEKCSKSNVVIQIIDKSDCMLNTRTEQLALPKKRYLDDLKKREAFKYFQLYRKSQVNRIYRKSLLSLYSRLANIQPEEEPEKRQPWDKETRMRIKKSLKKLAKPKKDFSKEKPKSPPKGPWKLDLGEKKSNPRRLAKLSRPKKYTEIEINKWCLTEALLHYKPTKRIWELSKPRVYVSKIRDEAEVYRVQPDALLYKATKRIKKLAIPQKFNLRELHKVEINPFAISPTALKAKITKRVEELSAPKEYPEPPINENPYIVSKAALKAKISPRVKELAQPRKIKKS